MCVYKFEHVRFASLCVCMNLDVFMYVYKQTGLHFV